MPRYHNSHMRHAAQSTPVILTDEIGGHTPASFVCPNCDGEITVEEHDTMGICGDCYFAVAEHVQHSQDCLH